MKVYVWLLVLLVVSIWAAAMYVGFSSNFKSDDGEQSTSTYRVPTIGSRFSDDEEDADNMVINRAVVGGISLFSNEIEEECKTPDKLRGTCIDLTRCNEILRLMNKDTFMILHKNSKNILKRYHCGFEGSRPKVCCPIYLSLSTTTQRPPVVSTAFTESSIVTSTSRPSVVTSTTVSSTTSMNVDIQLPPDVTNHRNLRLLPSSCGDFEDNRIFGGSKPDIFDYPWMALLLYRNEMSLEIGCGGSIINSKYVLTAAHCLKQRGRVLETIRIGEFNTETDPDCEAGVCAPPHIDFGFEKYMIHPQYTSKQMFNDIGLIRLNGFIDFRLHGYPICLPVDSSLRLPKFVGDQMTVAGWGATENFQISSVLLHTKVPVIDNVVCDSIFFRGMGRSILPSHICAGGEKGVDSCIGDSGGPLMDIRKVNGIPRYVQHGIVSYGAKKCGTFGMPAVHTRVAYFMDWLLDLLEP